jgi:transcriptional regulator
VTGVDFHRKTYEQIATVLKGYTCRSVISFVDVYRKVKRRFELLEKEDVKLVSRHGEAFDKLMHTMVRVAHDNGIEIVSCAEKMDLLLYGIRPGKCVDDRYIAKTFGLSVTDKKDSSQRKACGCVVSKDIGMYDSCLFDCQYCYATTDHERAKVNYGKHDPKSPSLISRHNKAPKQESL